MDFIIFLINYLFMRNIFIIVFTGFSLSATAQKKENLFYYFYQDTLLGMKNAAGKIIIPPIHVKLVDNKNGDPVEDDNIIYLLPHYRFKQNDEPKGFGLAYDRKGKILFTPYQFDNGPDYFSEGMSRYVNNNKVGFVNRKGEVVIEAKYDFVSSFEYGIARYCNGCYWDRSKDEEHPPLVGGTWGYINLKGEELQPSLERKSIKDQIADSGYYLPYPFSYTAFEQKIIAFFDKQILISKAHFVNYFDPLNEKEKVLHYEIVERPSSFFPYYHIKAFSFTDDRGYSGNDMLDLNFLVSKDGKQFFYQDYDDKKIPFQSWLIKYVAEAKKYLKTHPDAVNRF